MEQELLDRFDALVAGRGYANRSEALRDLARRELDQQAWLHGKETVATITLVYDHHVRELTERLTEIQHDHAELIISTLHVHLDARHCMEVVAAKGPAAELKALADHLISAKGVESGNVVAARAPLSQARPRKHAHRHR